MWGRGVWSVCAACTMYVACAPEPVVVSLDLETYASALIVVEEGEKLEAHAVDASSAAIADYPSGSELRFTALLYERSLAELGLARGRVTFAGPGDSGRALPLPQKTLERSVARDEATRWMEVGAPSAKIAALELRGEPACPTLENLWRAPLEGALAPSLLAVTATSAWVIAANGLLWELDADGARLIASPLPNMRSFSAVRSREGAIYVALETSPNGEVELYAGRAGQTFRARARPAPWNESMVLAAANDPNDGAAFYALADGETLSRYDARADLWTPLDSLDCGFGSEGPLLTDLRPDDVLCNGPQGDIQRSDQGLKTIEVLPRARENLAALAHFPGVGTFAGSIEGAVSKRGDDGKWTSIYEPEELALQILAFEVGRDRTLYIGGNFGTIGRYTAEAHLCSVEDALVLGATLSIRRLAALDEVMLFLVEDASTGIWSVGAFR